MGRKDEVGTIVDSPMLATGADVSWRIAFPYASSSFGPDYQDWTRSRMRTMTTPLTARKSGVDFAAGRWMMHYGAGEWVEGGHHGSRGEASSICLRRRGIIWN